jgi:hypothetical protein
MVRCRSFSSALRRGKASNTKPSVSDLHVSPVSLLGRPRKSYHGIFPSKRSNSANGKNQTTRRPRMPQLQETHPDGREVLCLLWCKANVSSSFGPRRETCPSTYCFPKGRMRIWEPSIRILLNLFCLSRTMDVVVDGAGFEPAASAMPTLRSYQTDLPAQS